MVTIALAARAAVLVQLHDHPLLQPVGQLDSGVYVDLARQVAAGDLALRDATAGQPFFLAPLYVYFLGLVFRLTGGSLLAAKLVQVGLGTAAVVFLCLAARPWIGRRAALVAALLLALCGPVVFHEVLFLQATLDPFLTALALFLLSRAIVSGGALAWGVAGAGIGLFALNRPNALLWGAALVLALPIAAGRAGWRRSTRDAAALALGLALAIAPATLRNLAVSGEPVLVSSHGGLNFYVGNRAEADGTYRHVPGITPDIRGQARDARLLAEEAAGRHLTAREVDAHFQHLALDWIAGHPLDTARLFLRKLAYVFAAPEISLNYSYAYYARDEPTLVRWLAVGAWLLVPLGLLGLADRLRTGALDDAKVEGRGGFALWALVVPVYALSVAAFFVSSRYRLPLLVPLAAGAGFALVRVHELARAHEARRLALYATILLPFLTLAFWPHRLDDGRSEERTVMLLWLVDNGRADEALRRLPAVLAAHPDPAQLKMRIGQALLEAGRAADAMPHLQAALDAGRLGGAASLLAVGQSALELRRPELALPFLDRAVANEPGVAAAHEKRGLALAMLHRPAEARAELAEVCRLDSKSASARLNLAVLEAQEGRLDAARALASEALRLQPDYPQARGLLAELERVR